MAYTKISKSRIIDWLKENLNDERYRHVLAAAECAEELAPKYNIDPEKAYIAGLLHDCAKCFDIKRLLEIVRSSLDVCESEMMNYKTLHAPVSAYIAQTDFGVDDKDILSAIRWHTLGKPDMNTFEKIIFLADKIEPETRDKNYVTKIRKLLEEENGLNKALLECYKETVKSLVNRNLKICTITIEIYNKLQDTVNVSVH